MNKKKLQSLIREIILFEFKEDLKKQCVVLMGLPASGKSTFIKTEAKKYIPGFSAYTVSNSDNQVKAYQFDMARQHYNFLVKELNKLEGNNDKIEKVLNAFKEETKYITNRGLVKVFPIDLNWWIENKGKINLKTWFQHFYKMYYATYFDIRDFAMKVDKSLFIDKVIKSGNILVIDTVGSKSEKIFSRLRYTRDNDFINTIIYLEIDPELCLSRDKYRERISGRGVGEAVIFGYADKMEMAYRIYLNDGKKDDGLVDRVLHFIWRPEGDSHIKGHWQKLNDYRFSLQRKVEK